MSIFRRIANLFRRSELEQEIDRELKSHLEMRIADSVAAGMSRVVCDLDTGISRPTRSAGSSP